MLKTFCLFTERNPRDSGFPIVVKKRKNNRPNQHDLYVHVYDDCCGFGTGVFPRHQQTLEATKDIELSEGQIVVSPIRDDRLLYTNYYKPNGYPRYKLQLYPLDDSAI